jgi:hypothetical protein
MGNIFRVYKDSQVTTDRIRAENAAQSIVTPDRVVYVFGTADGTAPNFSTVSSALTYADSLTPSGTEPVVIRMFADSDGEPYTLAGLDPWSDYANDGIYFVSDFVRLNTSTTLPTTLPAGAQVWYIDANGVETLWVGHEDGSAWPSVGYKEFTAFLANYGTTTAPVATVKIDTIGGTTTYTRQDVGIYRAVNPAFVTTDVDPVIVRYVSVDDNAYVIQTQQTGFVEFISIFEGAVNEGLTYVFTYRVYP